ncbi:MAG: hypothetical protein MOGMAGMI_01435 [Candidatus Omnitrophica bacterium]|nr:hypothetical protein [Candidatus Omnitrophota bacterium]
MSPSARKKVSSKTSVRKKTTAKPAARKTGVRKALPVPRRQVRRKAVPAPPAPVIGRPQQLEHGVQPIDALLERYGLTNAHLVNASTEQITFKMVHKARRGRHLTPKVKTKILNALHNCLPDETFAHRQLFNY